MEEHFQQGRQVNKGTHTTKNYKKFYYYTEVKCETTCVDQVDDRSGDLDMAQIIKVLVC